MGLERSQEQKILDAAYTIIAKKGYAEASIRKIAHEAEVAMSQIHYHYKSKEGLLLAVVERLADNYYEYLKQYLDPSMSPRQKGECFIKLYQQVLEKDTDMFRVLYDLVGLALWSEPFRLQVKEIFSAIMKRITEEVFTKELMEELGYKYDAETLASVFFGGLFGIALQALLETENEAIPRSLSALVVLFK